MKKTICTLLFVVGFLLLGGTAHATNDVYIAHAAAGANDGSSCANAFVYTYGSDPTNWSATPTGRKIGPGTTVHLCDQVTGGAGCSNLFNFRNDVTSGTAGNPVTLKFEQAGSAFLCPSVAVGRQILETQSNGGAYFVVDGNNVGVVGLTLTGSPGGTCPGGTCTSQNAGKAVNFGLCTNCEIKNLIISNMYVHTKCEASSGCDIGVDDTMVVAVFIDGNNFSVHDNIIHDCGWCIEDFYSTGNGTNHQYYNNNVYNMTHGLALAGSCDGSGFYFYGNHLHDMDNWDTGTADAYHHDGIHGFCGNTSGTATGLYMYNNLFNGNEGDCCVTDWVFLEGGTGAGRTPWTSTGVGYFFNNVVIGSTDIGGGQISMFQGSAENIYNNTIIAGGPSGGVCLGGGAGSNIQYTIENNVLQGCTQVISMDSTARVATIDYNVYGNAGGSNPIWQMSNYTATNTFSTWKTACGCDAHSQDATGAPLVGVNASTGAISAGFIGIGTGVNLTSIASGSPGLAALAFDTSDGNSRVPSARAGGSTAWDVGAFNSGSTAPAVALSVSSIAFGNQTVNVTSSGQTVTLTNSGNATLTITSIALTTGTQFAISANTCGGTLAALGTCTVTVTFTPTTAGAKSDSLVFTTNAASSPDSVALSGTGVIVGGTISSTITGGALINGGGSIR